MPTYLIIGDGAAGMAAAQTVRAEDAEATVTVLSDDPSPYYYRAALTNYLLGQLRDEQLWGVTPGFYRRHRIGRFFGRVLGVDTQAMRVSLDNGLAIPYDSLLIASGAAPRRLDVPGTDLVGVSTFRTLQDVRSMMELLPDVQHAVVVGGGPLGLEWVQALRHHAIAVTYILRESRLMPRVLDDAASALVLDELHAAGVNVLVEDEIVAIEPRSSAEPYAAGTQRAVGAVVTRGGRRIPCQLVGIAIGTQPTVGFLAASGVATDAGVLVDRHLRTNVSAVFAAGDVAQVSDPLAGGDMPPAGLWQPARTQGQVAGANMARLATGREPRVYDPGAPFQATHLYGLDFAAAGQPNADPADGRCHTMVERPGPRAYRRLVLRDGLVQGGLFIGDRRGALLCKRLIDAQLDISHVRDRLLDPHFDLAGWIRLGIGRTGGFLPARPVFDVRPAAPPPMAQRPSGARPVYDSPTQPLAPPAPVTTMVRRPAALRLGDQVIPLKAAEATTIGRDSSCDVVLPAGFVSRRHAEVVPVEGGYTLRDLGSANGTWVGLTRVQPDQPHYLHDGETIRIAETFLGFAFGSAAIQGSAVRPPPLEFVLQGPNGATPLVQDVINLGRNSENDVVVPARAASRLHAQIQRSGDGMFFLYDMGGTNGTLVNGARITDAHQLHDGDTIELAGIHYQVEQAGLAGRPKAPLTPAALTVAAGASAGLRFLLEAGETRIGRAREPENALVLDDPLVSRRHASITIDDGNAVLRDLGSLGGTQVNGQPLAGTRQLASGDSIQIGQTRLIYQAHDDATATAPVGEGAPGPTSLDRTLPFPTLRFPPPMRDQLPEVVMPVLLTEVGVLAGQPFPLRLGATVIIGRGSEMQRREDYLALNDGKASRRHARVQATADGTVSVEDLDSSNGTYVNDARIAGPQPLHEGDRLRIGDTVLRFTTAGAPRQPEERQ